MADTLLIKNATVLSMDKTIGDMVCADILIKGERIAEINKDITAPAGSTAIDARGCIAIPGFVDCHRHSWEGVLRSIHPNSDTLMEYFRATNAGFRTVFRPQDVAVGTRATILAAIDSGTTAVVDNMHCNRSPEHARASVKEWLASGLDAIVALEPAPFGSPVPTKHEIKDLLTSQTAGIPENQRDRVQVGLFAHFDKNEVEAARETGAPIIHEILQGFDGGLVALNKEINLQTDGGAKFIFNHATGISDEAWDIIKKLDASVNVCPRSDAQWSLGGGFCAYDAALERGIRPGLSIDNELAYGGDMFGEMKMLFHSQRAMAAHSAQTGDKKGPQPVQARAVLEAATVDGATTIGRGDQLGRLAPGLLASLVLLRVDGPSHYPAHTSVGQTVLSADRSNVDTVIARGKILKRDGKIVGLDWDKVKAEIDESVAYLTKAAEYQGSQITETFDLGKVE